MAEKLFKDTRHKLTIEEDIVCRRVYMMMCIVAGISERIRFYQKMSKCAEIKRKLNKLNFTHGTKKKNRGLGSTWIKHA